MVAGCRDLDLHGRPLCHCHPPSTELSLLLHFGRETAMPKKKILSSFNPEQQPDPTNTAIAQFTIQYGLRASAQHTGRLTVTGMYKNCTREESPEIGI